MSAITPTRRGWCPTVWEPMRAGDGLLARVKPRRASMTAAQARALAVASEAFGNGLLNLTNRANIQVRGLTESSASGFASAMCNAGLADADPGRERRRNIVISPLIDLDPALAPDTGAMADRVEACLAGAASLPPKFGVVVDGGGAWPLSGAAGAVHITARAHDRWTVTRETTPISGATHPGPVGPGHFGFSVAPVFGALHARGLERLADIAEREGDATIRVTPWRTLLLARVAHIAGESGMIVDPADPRRAVTACVGRPGCAHASVDTQAAASMLAEAGVAGHVAGCVKGCGAPRRTPIMAVGRDGLFDLVRDGATGDAPTRTAIPLADLTRAIACR